MERRELEELLRAVAAGEVSPGDAEERLSAAPFEDLGYAKPDTHRGIRQGVSEVVYGAGKTVKQVVQVMFIYFGLLPDAAIMAIGLVTGHPALGALGAAEFARRKGAAK